MEENLGKTHQSVSGDVYLCCPFSNMKPALGKTFAMLVMYSYTRLQLNLGGGMLGRARGLLLLN